MPISFTCPHCGTKTDVAERYAGRTGACSSCGQSITIPNPFDSPQEKSSNRTTLNIVLVATVVGLGLALCCVVALFLPGEHATGKATGAIRSEELAEIDPAEQATRDATRTKACRENLHRIGVAMHNYLSAKKRYPPAYVTDGNGKPLYSWRVLLLNFMGESDLYHQFHLDESWDSPHNLTLLDKMPDVYRCPSADKGDTTTSYVLITGPECVFDGAKKPDVKSIHDGTAYTIMVVETTDSGIQWTEPRDLSSNSISFGVNDGLAEGLRTDHARGCSVLVCDSSVYSLDESIDPAVIRAITTKAGGEPVANFLDSL